MSCSIRDRIGKGRRRLLRSALIRGSAICVAAGTIGLIGAGFADWIVRSNHPSWRLCTTLGAVIPAMCVAVRLLLPLLRDRMSAVDFARRAEALDPLWGGELSAAAAFAEGDAQIGSAAIRARVVAQAEQHLLSRPLPDLANRSSVARSVIWAALGCLLATAAVAAAPSAAVTAFARIALPFADLAWPRRVDLLLLSESGKPLPASLQIGRGRTLRFTVVNTRGDVPEDLVLEVALPGGRRSEPVATAKQHIGGGSTRLIGVVSLFVVEGPVRFRAVGGDHGDMPYVTAQVVPVPELEKVSLTVIPPAYIGNTPYRLPPGSTNVTAIVGSSVQIEALASQPVVAASLAVGDGSEKIARVGADRKTITATIALTDAGVYPCQVRLRDAGGVETADAARFEIRAKADSAPQVRISDPPEDLSATPEAELPVLVEVTDDYGIGWVHLRFGLGGTNLVEEASASDAETQVVVLGERSGGPTAGTYPLVWKLRPLGLAPGDRVTFRAEAGDAFDGEPPHMGFSSARTLKIISGDDKRDELLEREGEIVRDLQRVRSDAGRLVRAVEELQAELVGRELGAEERDRIARAEAEDRRLSSQLVGPAGGIEPRIVRLRRELIGNGVIDDVMADRFDRVAKELGALRDDALARTNRAFTEAAKAEQAEIAAPALDSARRGLEPVLGSLDALLADLGAWQSRRVISDEVADLLSVQVDLEEQTEKAASETLGSAAAQLSEAQAANLERLGVRQAGLAERLERLGEAIERQSAGDETENAGDETDGTELRGIPKTFGGAALASAARAAGEFIQANDLGQARRLQAQVASQLRALRKLLSRTDTSSGGEETLRKETEELTHLAVGQARFAEGLRRSVDATQVMSGDARAASLADQGRLREDALRAERELRHAGAEPAASLVGVAARSMAESLERLTRGDENGAAQAAEEAAEQLAEARGVADEAAKERDQRLAREFAATAAEDVSALAERQRGLNAEVVRLDHIKSSAGRLTRSQIRTLRTTADAQRAVAEETTALAELLDKVPAVTVALKTAAARMARVAEALDADEVGPPPQGDGAASGETLERVAASLRFGQDRSRGGPEGGPARYVTDQPGQVVPFIAQLELLRGMQEDLLKQTEAADAAWKMRTASADDSELLRLAEEQAALSELFQRLVQEAGTNQADGR